MKRRNFFASLLALPLVPSVVKGMESETTVSGGIVTSGSIKPEKTKTIVVEILRNGKWERIGSCDPNYSNILLEHNK